MKCKKCETEILYTTKKCPVCENTFCDGEEKNNNCDYPTFEAKESKRFCSPSFVFWIIALSLFLPFLICNLIFHPKELWFLIFLSAIVELYILIRHTILGNRDFSAKIFFNTLGLSCLIASI